MISTVLLYINGAVRSGRVLVRIQIALDSVDYLYVSSVLGLLRRFFCLVEGIGDFTGNDRFADLLAHFLEHLAVFRTFNALSRCAEQLHAAFL